MEFMRTADVAGKTGVPEPTLRFWRQEKRGPKWAHFGRRVVYREADVEAWIAEQFEQASS